MALPSSAGHPLRSLRSASPYASRRGGLRVRAVLPLPPPEGGGVPCVFVSVFWAPRPLALREGEDGELGVLTLKTSSVPAS